MTHFFFPCTMLRFSNYLTRATTLTLMSLEIQCLRLYVADAQSSTGGW